jgi:hypothetical protein
MPRPHHHDETPNPTTQQGRGKALTRRTDWAALGVIVAVALGIGGPTACSIVDHTGQISSLRTQAERRDREIDQLRADIIKRLDRLDDKLDRLNHERDIP